MSNTLLSNTLYVEINLAELLKGIGEDETKHILSSFYCPLNSDVESFLKTKAIEFSKQGIAKTQLVFWASEDEAEKELVGYYALATKSFSIRKNDVSKSAYRRISKYGTYDDRIKECTVPSILIGQLGKNYADGNNCLISGAELLELAINRIRTIQNQTGGRYTYLECEDKPKLLDFYTQNGFTSFGRRTLDKDETNISGSYLIQLLRDIR